MSENKIERTIDLKAPVAKVWMALTNHKQFGEWFGCILNGPFVVGKVTEGTLNFPGFEHMQWGVDVKALETEKRFAFTWHPYPADASIDYTKEPQTLVEFLLEGTSSGTRLMVVESGFENIPAGRRLEVFRVNTEGWIEQLENVAQYVR